MDMLPRTQVPDLYLLQLENSQNQEKVGVSTMSFGVSTITSLSTRTFGRMKKKIVKFYLLF